MDLRTLRQFGQPCVDPSQKIFCPLPFGLQLLLMADISEDENRSDDFTVGKYGSDDQRDRHKLAVCRHQQPIVSAVGLAGFKRWQCRVDNQTVCLVLFRSRRDHVIHRMSCEGLRFLSEQVCGPVVEHPDLPLRIHNTESISHRMHYRLKRVTFLSQVGVAGSFGLSSEVQRPFQQSMDLISLSIASVDCLKQVAPHRRWRRWMRFIEAQPIELMNQQRMHKDQAVSRSVVSNIIWL